MSTPAWRRYLRFLGSNVQSVSTKSSGSISSARRRYTAREMTPDEARRLAERRFGDEQKARAECVSIDENAARAMSRGASIASLSQDVRFAARLLRRQAATASLAVLCLALGIGATTAMFSVADALLIRPLPFATGDRLFLVATTRDPGRDADVSSYPDYLDWRARQHSFSELAAFGQTSFSVVLARPVRASGAVVTANFFRALGVVPERGRLFADGEDQMEGPAIAVVSHGFAEREMGGVDRAVGSAVSIRGIPRTVVGVIPDGRAIPVGGELWTPLPRDMDRSLLPGRSSLTRSNRGLQVIGWLAPNATVGQARAEFESLEAELVREYPENDAGLTTKITPIRDVYVGSAHSTLVTMIAATILVLLVSCANVAGIQLARATSRVREIAVRSAIAAGRGRVFRQLLTESVMLALAGGVLGTALAYRVSEFAEISVLGQSPRWLMPSLDLRVLAFAVAISMLTGIVFGVAPAMRLTRVDPADALRGGRSALGPSRGRLQQIFVVVQLALSIVLVVAAGLSIESVRRLEELPLGFDERGALDVHRHAADAEVRGGGRARAFRRRSHRTHRRLARRERRRRHVASALPLLLAVGARDRWSTQAGGTEAHGPRQFGDAKLFRCDGDPAGARPSVLTGGCRRRAGGHGRQRIVRAALLARRRCARPTRAGWQRPRDDRRHRARREDHVDRIARTAVLSPADAEAHHDAHVCRARTHRRSDAIHERSAPHRP